MRFYALVLWRMRGVVPTMLQLVYLGNRELLRYSPDEADLLATERKVKALWTAIERAATTGDWRPSPSKLCDWCDHRAICPAWGGTPPPLPERASLLAVDPDGDRPRRPSRRVATNRMTGLVHSHFGPLPPPPGHARLGDVARRRDPPIDDPWFSRCRER